MIVILVCVIGRIATRSVYRAYIRMNYISTESESFSVRQEEGGRQGVPSALRKSGKDLRSWMCARRNPAMCSFLWSMKPGEAGFRLFQSEPVRNRLQYEQRRIYVGQHRDVCAHVPRFEREPFPCFLATGGRRGASFYSYSTIYAAGFLSFPASDRHYASHGDDPPHPHSGPVLHGKRILPRSPRRALISCF